MHRILGIVVSIGIVTGASVALAQDPPQCREVRRGVIECGEWNIEGDSGRAFVLLPRTRDDYEAPPLERDLAREIRRTVHRTPF